MGKFLKHTACPCGKSSDGFAVYDDGNNHCFSCNKHFKNGGQMETGEREPFVKEERAFKEIRPLPTVFHDYDGYNAATARKYGITVVQDKESDISAVYPLYRDGVHIGNKLRTKDKKFPQEGDVKNGLDLFGQNLFPPGSAKAVTVTEGQDDAPAAYEMMGSRYPVVSVHSSGSAVRDCKRNYEYLDSFEQIVLCFDFDEAKVNPESGEKSYPGQEAARKCASLFKPGKVRVVSLKEHKDPRDYSVAKKAAKFTKEWWDAPVVLPDGLKVGTDMWPDIMNRPNHYSTPYPYESMNKATYGIRLSEAVIVQAPSGTGKTTFLKAIEYQLLMDPDIKEKDYGVAFLHFEEPKEDTAIGLMSIHNSKPYHLPDVERTDEELRSAYDAVINTHRFVLWDHFGSNSIDAVLNKVRHMHAMGCKYFFIDHLSIIVSDQSGDERKQLDEISTKLKTMCMELNIAIICVIHENRQGEIRGSAGVEQLANIVMKLERDKNDIDEWRRNITRITIVKNRFCGRTGPTCWLWYNEITGVMEELSKEQVEIYESGGTRNDAQRAFG